MEHEKSVNLQHVEETPPSTGVLVTEARQAANAEQHMTLWQALKMYKKAAGWSVLLSATLIMEGHDLALLGSLYASPIFNEKYGTLNAEDGKYHVSAAWQSGLSNGARAGEIIGLIIAGWTADRYGYKMTIIGSLVLMIVFIFVLFFAPNVQILVLGEVLCGMLETNPSEGKTDHAFRHPMGRLPKCDTSVCVRGGARGTAAIPDDLHQHVLGDRTVLRSCREQRLRRP